MSGWNGIFDFEWNVGDHARPNVARLTFDYLCRSESDRRSRAEREIDIVFDLEHPYRDGIIVGEMVTPGHNLPEWLIEEERPLFVRADADGHIDAIYYAYETQYDTPAYGFFELDPSASNWATIPAGTHSVLRGNSEAALLWHWGDEPDIESAPPTGATDVMTREQPNDADVPLFIVPEPLLPGVETVITSPENATGAVPTDQFVKHGNPTDLHAYRRVRGEYLDRTVGGDETSIVIDIADGDTNWKPDGQEWLAVAEVFPDEDRFLAVNARLGGDGVTDVEFGDRLFNIAVSAEAFGNGRRQRTTDALIRQGADVTGFTRGDLLLVARADDADGLPDVETIHDERAYAASYTGLRTLIGAVGDDVLDDDIAGDLLEEYTITPEVVDALSDDIDDVDALRAELDELTSEPDLLGYQSAATFKALLSPYLTAAFNHNIPDFENFPSDPHPDNFVDAVPAEHEIRYTEQEDEPRDYTCAYAAGPPETKGLYEHTHATDGYALFCERPALPDGVGERPTVRYECPTDGYGQRERITRLWPEGKHDG